VAFVRVYTGTDRQSRFEDLPIPFYPNDTMLPGTFSQNSREISFRRQPVGLVQDWHTAPRRQYIITLTGQAEIEVGNGEIRVFKPGDILLAEDLTGYGHITRVVGTESRISVTIPLED